jgi:hypothetical protein
MNEGNVADGHKKNQLMSVPVATLNGLTVHAIGLSLRPTTLER